MREAPHGRRPSHPLRRRVAKRRQYDPEPARQLQATATTADDAEENAHLEFGTNRCADFVGREKQLKEIARYVAAADPQLMVVVGEGGSGKSAWMAQAYRRSADKRGEVRIERFVGATPDASKGRALLGSLCRQITHAYGGDSSAIPSEYNDLAVEFGRQLEKATSARPLVVFVDAVDQLGGDDQPAVYRGCPRTFRPTCAWSSRASPTRTAKAHCGTNIRSRWF